MVGVRHFIWSSQAIKYCDGTKSLFSCGNQSISLLLSVTKYALIQKCDYLEIY